MIPRQPRRMRGKRRRLVSASTRDSRPCLAATQGMAGGGGCPTWLGSFVIARADSSKRSTDYLRQVPNSGRRVESCDWSR